MLLSFCSGKDNFKYLIEGELNEDKTTLFTIFFQSKMVVTEQFWAYGFLAYIGEIGGFFGLFLGYSVLQLRDLVPFILSLPEKQRE